jgi:hypothetical protein
MRRLQEGVLKRMHPGKKIKAAGTNVQRVCVCVCVCVCVSVCVCVCLSVYKRGVFKRMHAGKQITAGLQIFKRKLTPKIPLEEFDPKCPLTRKMLPKVFVRKCAWTLTFVFFFLGSIFRYGATRAPANASLSTSIVRFLTSLFYFYFILYFAMGLHARPPMLH